MWGDASVRTQRGLIILVGLIVLAIIVPRLIIELTPDKDISIVTLEKGVVEIERKEAAKVTHQSYKTKRKSKFKVPQRAFDPNDYQLKDWMSLGLSEKQAGVVLSFAKRGLRSDEDLKKVFVISDELFQLIEDSTFYPSTVKSEISKKIYAKTEEKVLLDLNLANYDELLSVNGIGPFYAKNILKYREELGGFIDKRQLLEVWKLSNETYDKIESHLLIQDQNIKKLNLNKATYEELYAHPYIDKNVANSIVKMRTQLGGYSDVKEISNSVLINATLYSKLAPYLTL